MTISNFKFFLISTLILQFGNLFSQQWGEYTFYSLKGTNTAVLLDTNGTLFKAWTFPTTDKTGYSSYVLQGGTVLRTVARTGNSFNGGPICGQVQKVDWNNNVLWNFVYSTTTYCSHHDICPMPNGNVLLIAYESKTAAEVTAAGSTSNIIMWPDKIVEVKPTGLNTADVVWEWHAWDHLSQNVDAAKSNYQSSIVNHPELLNINYKTTKDWMHVNGVSYNAELDQIAISSHNMNEIYIIDHSTTTAQAASHSGGNSGKGGDILYRWGNPAAYGASGTAVFNVVHDAHWIPKGCPREGYLVGFNNNGVSTTKSAVDFVNPPRYGYNYDITLGSAYLPSTYSKRYPCNGYTSNEGGSQQMPNGNVLITIALSGNVYEIDSNGNTLWSKTLTGSTAKAFRYTGCYILGTPAIPTITQNGNILTSSNTVGNQWYFNGSAITGATAQTYTATQNGNYQVKGIHGANCESALSTAIAVNASGINNGNDATSIRIYPNPSNGRIIITGIENRSNTTITIYDALGKFLLNMPFNNELDLSSLESGFYYISLKNNELDLSTQKISIIKP